MTKSISNRRLDECFGLLTGQLVPISGLVVRGTFLPIVMFLTTSDLMRPDQNSDFSWARSRAALPWIQLSGAPFVDSVAFLPCRNSRAGQRDYRWKTNVNTLAQAELRRDRLKNNTTRLSPAPDQAICNCWHKPKLAGYPPVRNNLNPFFLHGPTKRRRWTQRRLRVLFPVPVNVGGDELQPSHASIRLDVEDDARWSIAKEVLCIGLRK